MVYAMTTTLRTEAVSRRFDIVNAVVDATVDCRAHEIVGLIGPNGARKTTLLGLIAGQIAPHSGSVRIGDYQIDRLRAESRARMGIAQTFQSTRLFGSLTVGDRVTERESTRTPSGGIDRLLDRLGEAYLVYAPGGVVPLVRGSIERG